MGTSRVKAVLVDPGGGTAASSAVATPWVVRGERVEAEVGSLRAAVAAALAALGPAALARVAAVGVAGMAEAGAGLDRGGRPVTPVIAWHDGRGQEAADALDAALGPELHLRVGQRLRRIMTVAKLGWLAAHGPADLARWLGVPELVLSDLTGAQATEFSLAARTGCYDLDRRTWIPEVGAVLGFDVSVFAPVEPAGAAMGRVSGPGSAWSGLSQGIPVTVAGHDHPVGLAGAGVEGDEVANSVGTAETLVARCAHLPDVAAALERRVAVGLHPGGREWAALVSVVRSGIVVETAAAALGLRPAELDRLVTAARPGPGSGSGSQVELAAALDELAAGEARAVVGAGPPAAVWDGLLWALAARAGDAYRRLTEVVGPRQGVVVFGGGSVSEPWLEAKAERLPVPLRRPEGLPAAGSAVARGAAFYAGAAAGWWPSYAASGGGASWPARS